MGKHRLPKRLDDKTVTQDFTSEKTTPSICLMSYIRYDYVDSPTEQVAASSFSFAALVMSSLVDDFAGATPAFSPLYQQIKELILQSLQSGEWKPGEAIPSEMDLASRYRVSQGTVRKAVDELATDNLVVRRQGKGTFVIAAERVPTPILQDPWLCVQGMRYCKYAGFSGLQARPLFWKTCGCLLPPLKA